MKGVGEIGKITGNDVREFGEKGEVKLELLDYMEIWNLLRRWQK